MINEMTNNLSKFYKQLIMAVRTGFSKPIIIDTLTGLPTLISFMPYLIQAMAKGKVGVLYIDIENFTGVEALYGRNLCSQILLNVGKSLKKINTGILNDNNKLGVCSMGGDDFLIFIKSFPQLHDYDKVYSNLKEDIEKGINQANSCLELNNKLHIHLEYTEIQEAPGFNPESIIYSAIKKASYSAKRYANLEEQAHRYLLNKVLDDEMINILYQPIVSLRSGSLLGYEALSRGPRETYFESPENLFTAAEKFECLFELESLSHKLAAQSASSQLGDLYLFLNVNPLVLNAANHKKGQTRAILREYGIDCSKVVLELTERTAITDYSRFREALNYYRNQGFLIAIDDAGSGYSSLQAIAELRPEMIKIDMSLVRDVDKSPTKKAILETFVDFSYKISSRIICEGIENKEELKVVTDIGCDYGQGFLLGRPGTMQTDINKPICEQIQLYAHHRRLSHGSNGNKLGDIFMYHEPIKPEVPVHFVVDMFKDHKYINCMVVCDEMIPIGLVIREKLFAMLGTKYGYDLFMRRSVAEVMDKDLLILPWFTPIEEAARQVAERLDKGLTDYVVVVRDKEYEGVISVAKLVNTMATIHIKQAQDANPLTGLPGNRCIAERITIELDKGNNIAVLYFDLDNFKAFNDYYGFERGDRAIILLAEIISRIDQLHGNEDDLVGHIGGDDFVIVTTPDRYEIMAHQVINEFDHSIIDLYDRSSLEQGFIITDNRQGQKSQIPIMTVSIAGVINNNFKSNLELGEVAAELKKLAKRQQGSNYLGNQRCHLNPLTLQTNL